MVRMLTCESREAWLKMRTSYIGGSEAASIVGMNPYRSNVALWELKTGRRPSEDISDNPYVRYGSEAERFLRELFRLDFPQYTVGYAEHNIWLNSDYPFAHASLDGWLETKDGRHGVLEIKTTTIQSIAQYAKWKDRIPDSYYCQVLHYLMVTGFDFAILKAQIKWQSWGDASDIRCEVRHYVIDREDVADDIAVLIESERKFAECLTADKCPALVLLNV